ncbi:MAG: response regulator transcription factor [Pyrinomonadaceae bacterium]|nr:response regulator transcription factor [Pyrinomonadaceae bacterium]
MRKVREFVKRARILLADDHDQMRRRIQRHLEPEFEVLDTFGNGLALLEAASRLEPDVCVLDISMPVLNGLETATRLKQSGSTAKIVFLAVVDDPDYVQAAIKIGASGYVVKRRMLSELRPAINEALAGRVFVSSSIDLGAAPEQNGDGPQVDS